MAKIIALNRKYFFRITGVVVICLVALAGISLWRDRDVSVSATNEAPEIKMLGVAVEPAAPVRDLTYGNVTLEGVQVITTNTFDLIATVQNTTAKKMTDIPVELQITLVGDDSKKVISPGTLPSLEPGATARVAFRQIQALGDAQGKSATDGQHLMTIGIKPNPKGGVEQATEASFRFTVDTTVKASAADNK